MNVPSQNHHNIFSSVSARLQTSIRSNQQLSIWLFLTQNWKCPTACFSTKLMLSCISQLWSLRSVQQLHPLICQIFRWFVELKPSTWQCNATHHCPTKKSPHFSGWETQPAPASMQCCQPHNGPKLVEATTPSWWNRSCETRLLCPHFQSYTERIQRLTERNCNKKTIENIIYTNCSHWCSYKFLQVCPWTNCCGPHRFCTFRANINARVKFDPSLASPIALWNALW